MQEDSQVYSESKPILGYIVSKGLLSSLPQLCERHNHPNSSL